MKTTADTELIHGDPECSYKHFTAKVGEPINPDADEDIVCFMSTDSVDSDDEVMLPNGIDLSRFTKNPVVMLCHAMGQPGCYYPLPVGKALWTKQAKRGVLAGVRFTDKTEMGREVKALFGDEMLRSFSVGFRPIEASGMTRKEAESRPDWQAAYERTKGQVRVHRKWSLIELSVAPIPSNPDALVTTYKAKGILVPSWLNLKETTMDDELEEVEDKTTAEPCKCGKAPCECEKPVETKADDEEPPKEEVSDEDDFDEADESALPIKTGDFVDINTRGHRGPGRVEKIHRRGVVDHVDEELYGTKDEPAARVRCYKAHGDGHMPCERKMGVRLKDLARRTEPLNPPSKKSVAEVEAKAAALEPLPPLIALGEAEVQQESIRQASEAAVKRINELFGVV